MAITEVHEPSEPLKVLKTWVLKVSIHCEGCKKKVKKILNSVPGVNNIDIDVKQHRVVVTGNVEADALLKKLLKSGKHAELLLPPGKPVPLKEIKPDEPPANKKLDKPISQNSHDVSNTEETSHAEEGIKPPPATIKPRKPPQVETFGTGPSGGKVADAAGQSTSGGKVVVEESKADDKKPEIGSPGNQTPPTAVEVLKSGESESVVAEKAGVSGNVSKKKKKKGQSGNKTVAEQSSALPASAESPNHDGGPPPTLPTTHSPPRHQGYQYPPSSYYYATPHAPHAYAVSYNTAQPSSSYTASYYASPPPQQSYAYSYPSQEMGPPPPQSADFDTYPRQPLDSFEMFSDENPNGCSIM